MSPGSVLDGEIAASMLGSCGSESGMQNSTLPSFAHDSACGNLISAAWPFGHPRGVVRSPSPPGGDMP